MSECSYITPEIAKRLMEQELRKKMNETTAYPTGCAEIKSYLGPGYVSPSLTNEETILSRIARLEQRGEVMAKDTEEAARQLFQRVERIERALGL